MRDEIKILDDHFSEFPDRSNAPEVISVLKMPFYKVTNWVRDSAYINYFGVDEDEAREEMDNFSTHEEKDKHADQSNNLSMAEPEISQEKAEEYVWLAASLPEEEFEEKFPDLQSVADFIDWGLGDFESIDSAEREADKTEDEIAEEIKDELEKEVRNYVKGICEESQLAAFMGSTFYGLYKYKDGFIQIRVGDHFFNPSNVMLGKNKPWDIIEPGSKYNKYRNIYGFISINIVNRLHGRQYRQNDFKTDHKYKDNKYGLVDTVSWYEDEFVENEEMASGIFETITEDLDERIEEMKEKIDEAMAKNLYEDADEPVELYSEGGTADSLQHEVESILKKTLPGFYISVKPYRFINQHNYLAIIMACQNYEINNVGGQMPQKVSLSLDVNTMELQPQVYGGTGGQRIYRQPNREDAKEKFLAMKGVQIPFRTPLKTKEAVLKAIERFAQSYKKTLQENIDVLMYQNIVDYKKLLNENNYASGGTASHLSVGGDVESEQTLGSKDFSVEFRNYVELQSDAKKEFAKEKGIKSFNDVPESERQKMQKDFEGYLEKYKKDYQTKVDKAKADNKTKFNELPIEHQRAVFHDYIRKNASSDYVIGRMIADGILDYTSKKSGKAYGKVKGAEMSSNQIPVKVDWEFGKLKGELETSYPNSRHSKEEYIGRAIFNAIETKYDELGVPKETIKPKEQTTSPKEGDQSSTYASGGTASPVSVGGDVGSKDFAFSNFSRGSIPYEKSEILDRLQSGKTSEDVNVLGYHEFEDLLNKLEKRKPKDIVGNHLFDKPNAVIVNDNGKAVVKLIDKDGKIGSKIFYTFKSIADAADVLQSVKERHRELQLRTLASMEDRGSKTELTKYADPLVVKKALEELNIPIPKSIKDKIKKTSVETPVGSQIKNNSEGANVDNTSDTKDTPTTKETKGKQEKDYVDKFKQLMDKNSETNKKRLDLIRNQKNMTADEIKRISDELTKESEDFVNGMNELSNRKTTSAKEGDQPSTYASGGTASHLSVGGDKASNVGGDDGKILWENEYGNKAVNVVFEENYKPKNKYNIQGEEDGKPFNHSISISGTSKGGRFRVVEIQEHGGGQNLAGVRKEYKGDYYVRGNFANTNISADHLTYEQAKSLAYKLLDNVINDDKIVQTGVSFPKEQSLSKQESEDKASNVGGDVEKIIDGLSNSSEMRRNAPEKRQTLIDNGYSEIDLTPLSYDERVSVMQKILDNGEEPIIYRKDGTEISTDRKNFALGVPDLPYTVLAKKQSLKETPKPETTSPKEGDQSSTYASGGTVDHIPEIVKRAMVKTVTDIGQLSPSQKMDLNRYVKKGILVKGLGGSYPKPKMVYALKSHDIAGERNADVKQLLDDVEKLEPGTVKYSHPPVETGHVLSPDKTNSPDVFSLFEKHKEKVRRHLFNAVDTNPDGSIEYVAQQALNIDENHQKGKSEFDITSMKKAQQDFSPELVEAAIAWYNTKMKAMEKRFYYNYRIDKANLFLMVNDESGKTIWNASYPAFTENKADGELIEDPTLVDAGVMTSLQDCNGLKKYLVEIKILTPTDTLINK